jgi:hypothetical protein
MVNLFYKYTVHKFVLDSVNFTPIDQPIVGPFPPMGNGYETVIIIQSTDANQAQLYKNYF